MALPDERTILKTGFSTRYVFGTLAFRPTKTNGRSEMRTILAAGALALALGASGIAFAEPVKVGMITTLSGGGAGLGVDARDGFMLAIKLSGSKDIEVVTEDDAMKPELAVQIADKMIQSDKVDVLTGIIWS